MKHIFDETHDNNNNVLSVVVSVFIKNCVVTRNKECFGTMMIILVVITEKKTAMP
jgi:hypothetical protein